MTEPTCRKCSHPVSSHNQWRGCQNLRIYPSGSSSMCPCLSGVLAPVEEVPRPTAVEPVEPPTGPERGTGEAGPEKGAQAATLREASVSIHTIADHMPGRHPEFVRGVRYAATLLDHTADDLGAGDG